jgi:two-component system chemotaxis response regulator CheY
MKQKIMVVDDEKRVRETIKLQLKHTGHQIIMAEDGGQAIELLKNENDALVDVIICDVRMPNINGVAAITYFRREHPSIPVIVLTGFPDVKLAVEFISKGVFDYLVKPVEREKLIKVVTKAAVQRSLFI